MKRRTRAVSYVVLPHGGYPDTASDYVECPTRADVEAQLVDYGWMENPAVTVFVVTKDETPAGVIHELTQSSDPYPDWVVEYGPRSGVRWVRA